MGRVSNMGYRTPEALEMAVKAAAKASPLDTNRAVSGFYFHRLLCRIFSQPDSPFILKGGQGMLARTVSARATRDIDLLAEQTDLESSLAELKSLAAIDLKDFITFEFAHAEPIKTEDEYRSGLSVSFVPLLGRKKMQDISIDLVVDPIACGEPEVVRPADRIEIDGLLVFDYRVYPSASSVADKLCAIIETHNGRPSSRIKDLVDVLVYSTAIDFDGNELRERILAETKARGILPPDRFSVPLQWHISHKARFSKLIRETELPSRFSDLGKAQEFAARFFDPVLSKEACGKRWDHVNSIWT